MQTLTNRSGGEVYSCRSRANAGARTGATPSQYSFGELTKQSPAAEFERKMSEMLGKLLGGTFVQQLLSMSWLTRVSICIAFSPGQIGSSVACTPPIA